MRKGDPNGYVIEWQVDPNIVLGSILEGGSFDDDMAKGAYWTVVSRNVPDLFQVLSRRIIKEGELLRKLDSFSRSVELLGDPFMKIRNDMAGGLKTLPLTNTKTVKFRQTYYDRRKNPSVGIILL